MFIVSVRLLIEAPFTEREQLMKHRDGILASLALALSVMLMAGLVGSDAFAHAAGEEARGWQALFHVVASNGVQQ